MHSPGTYKTRLNLLLAFPMPAAPSGHPCHQKKKKKKGKPPFLGNYPRPNPVQSGRHREMGTTKCPGGTEDILYLLLLILLSTNTGFKLN